MVEDHDQDHTEDTDYWQHDTALGDMILAGEATGVRLRLHEATEPYEARDEIVPLRVRRGERIYVHGRPYILEPEIRLTVELSSHVETSESVGLVRDVRWEGRRHREIGNCQAWMYPGERLLVLWEVDVFGAYRDTTPNDTVRSLWHGFEAWLTARFTPDRIVTPAWEPTYPDTWQEFLHGMGYLHDTERAFSKDLICTSSS